MRTLFCILFLVVIIVGCNDNKPKVPLSDSKSEALIEGLWINEEDESVVFKSDGDSLFYPDETIQPVPFRIYLDTLYLDGNKSASYFIEKLTSHVLRFRNSNGELVKLVKSDDRGFATEFDEPIPVLSDVNQELIKRDTIVSGSEKRYHCYVQINPTTYKVVKNQINNEGIEVERIYFDNIINLTIYTGAKRLFSRDFRKQDFENYIPAEILSLTILNDMILIGCDNNSVTYQARLQIPETASSYIVNISVSLDGKFALMNPTRHN